MSLKKLPGLVTALAFTVFTLPPGHAEESSKAASAQVEITIPSGGLPETWLQGEAVKSFAPGKLYVFEFWATWCGPCLQAMPHMEKLHQGIKDRKDVQIIGINVFDDTPTAKLLPFLKAKGLNPTYTMGADGSKEGSVAKNWLRPLGITGIPHSLAVRDGKIVWRGHPAELEDKLLEALTKADYQPNAAPPTLQEQQKALQPKQQEIRQAIRAGDDDKAAALLRAIAKDESIKDHIRAGVFTMAFNSNIALERYPQSIAVLKLIAECFPANRNALLMAGGMALQTEELPEKDPAFALVHANQLLAANPADVAALELKAAALFAQGNPKGAAEAQQQAVENTKLHAKILELRAKAAATPAR